MGVESLKEELAFYRVLFGVFFTGLVGAGYLVIRVDDLLAKLALILLELVLLYSSIWVIKRYRNVLNTLKDLEDKTTSSDD